MDLTAQKSSAIQLLVTMFSAANNMSHEARGKTSQTKTVEKMLTQEGINLDLPLKINTSDEYTQLYSAAFNAAAIAKNAEYANDYAIGAAYAAAGISKPSPEKVTIDSINSAAKKMISYMDGQGAIAIKKPLASLII